MCLNCKISPLHNALYTGSVFYLFILKNNPLQMSTFTMVHHTAPHIPFKSSEEWNAAQAQLNGTVHCNYPQWYVLILYIAFTLRTKFICLR